MNNRIKELMREARAKTPKHTSWEDGLLEYSDRFANLVIQECANVCRKQTYEFMEIKLDMTEEYAEFMRGSKSGKKAGASVCLTKILELAKEDNERKN